MDALERKLCDELIAQHGLVLNSAGLRMALGFTTQEALRAAITSGRIPIRTFTIPGRQGRYALTHEVAAWIAKLARDDPNGGTRVVGH